MAARRIIIFLLALLWCAASNVAVAATAVGETIENQATLTYIDFASGEPVEVLSNVSRLTVAAHKQFTLTTSQEITLKAGLRVYLVHELTNVGNVSDQYSVTVQNGTVDDEDLHDLLLYVDANNNGVVDASEPLVDGLIELDPDESASLIMTGVVPVHASGGERIEVQVTANSIELPDEQKNIDIITVQQIADIDISLTNSPGCGETISTNAPINFVVKALNNTKALPEERQILVDGQMRSGVLLNIDLPEGFILVKEEFLDIVAFQSIPIVRLDPDDENWRRYEHWTEDLPSAQIALLVAAEMFEEGELIEFAFAARGVSIPEDEYTVTFQASIDIDGDENDEFVSNTVCNQIFQPTFAEAQLRFIEPVLDIQREGGVPAFELDSDFTDTPTYSLNTNLVQDRNRELFIDYELFRDGVYIELDARISPSSLIFDSQNIAYAIVELESEGTGDTLQVVVRETGPGTSRYRSTRPVLLSETVEGGGAFCPENSNAALLDDADYSDPNAFCVLNSTIDDTINIYFEDPDRRLDLFDTAVINPTSVVFDSTSLQSVENATVYLKQGENVVLHPITDKPIVFRTNESGQFSLPRLLSGHNYHLFVEPPRTYVFPSEVAEQQFTDLTVNQYSYGEDGYGGGQPVTFSVARADAPPVIDIPLDPVDTTALLVIEKNVSSTAASPGDVLAYTASVTNNSSGNLTNLTVVDIPPFGFRFVPGSARLNDEPIDDPNRVRVSHDDGRLLSENYQGDYINALLFEIDALDVNQSKQIRYKMQLTPAALEGKGINTAFVSAIAESGVVIASNPSRAQVEFHRSGILSDDAIVFGKVYVDSTCDLIQNQGEWPIGGVRLYLQDGSHVTTDEDGQFSIYGLSPGTHVLRVDPITMPAGVILKPLDTRHAADPKSRFLNLSAGDFHRADFATSCPKENSSVFFTELKERNRNVRGDWLLDSASNFNPDGGTPRVDDRQRAAPDGDLSAGFVGGAKDGFNQHSADRNLNPNGDILDGSATPVATVTSGNSARAEFIGNPKELAKTITEDQAVTGTWLWPHSDISKDGRFMAVVRSGIDPVLYVNDVAVAGTKIGERIVNRRERAQIIAWYGVKLLAGVNNVEVRGNDAFSNERVLAKGKFKQPSSGVKLEISSATDTLYADGGRSVLPLHIDIIDRNGYPANGVYFVTLESSQGEFVEKDLQAQEPGVQVRVEDGQATVHLRSAETTGKVRITAATGALNDTLDLISIADLRPLFGVGLAEVGGRWSTNHKGADSRADLEDGFEYSDRVAVFLKGRVRNDLHLTLSYDSAKNSDTDLLQNLNPNEHYPTFGDASIRGYEAQSRSKLYAKLEKDRHSIMWGDYLTDGFSDIDSLGRVQRTLTGANAVYDNGRTRIQAFAAEQSDNRATEEIRGNGTAMLFQISGAPIVANSELVERIVRHRDNPGLVIESEPLQRYVDYTIEHIGGLLSFAEVIPTVDADLNPVYIRVSYDRLGDGEEYLVSGLRLQNKFSNSTVAGISLTDDQNPLSGYLLSSVFAKTSLGVNTVLVASQALQKHKNNSADGIATRVELTHQWGGRRDHRTSMTWARANNAFNNSGASISSGREETRIEHRHSITNTLKMNAEFLRSEARTDNSGYTSAGVTFDKTYEDWSFRLGTRHLRNFSEVENYSFNTVIAGVERRFSFANDRTGSIGFDIERDITNGNRFNYGIHSRVQVHDRVALYGRYEKDRGIAARSLLGEQRDSSLLTFGIESDVSPATRVYSEYRMRSSFNGTSVESASGIRGQYQIQPGLTLSPALEVIDGIRGADAKDSIALSVGFSDTRNPNRKLSARAEIRDTDDNTYYGFRGTVAQRLNHDWTALLREEFTRQTPDDGQLTSRHRFTFGLARRPKLNNRHHGLYLASWKEDYGPESGMDRKTYVLSTHQNRQVNSQLTLSGRVGAKWQRIYFDDGSDQSNVMLGDVRGTFDLKRRWEFDLRAGWLGTDGLGDGQYSYGLGLAWLVDRNARLGLAYNFVGFREDDLDEQGYNAQGVHLGLQIKFDEDWFRWLENE